MEFICTSRTEKRKRQWTATITGCKGNREKCEFELRSRGHYYHVIIGTHDFGHYVCVPNWDIGCELSDYNDIFWNTEQLSRRLCVNDAITVATAIREVRGLL